MIRYILAAALVACGGPQKSTTTGSSTDGMMHVETDAPIASEDIAFTVAGRSVPGTLVHPTTGGKRRAIVLMAGSGPTDRNWNSPLLQGDNGSARLLAEALGHKGFAVLRFDKAMTGGNKMDQTKVAFETYVDEGRAALAFMRARDDVDAAHLYIAGHSEGGIHAMRVALAEEKSIAGLLLLSSPGRSMMELIMMQLGNQYAGAVATKQIDKATADRELSNLKAAFDLFLKGKDVDPLVVSEIPAVQGLVAQIVNPATAALARPLFGFDPGNAIDKVTVPVLIYNGAHDLQVDPELDAKRLATKHPQALLFIAPEANHVMKHETKSVDELRKDLVSVQNGYNAPDAIIDGASVDAIVAFLAK